MKNLSLIFLLLINLTTAQAWPQSQMNLKSGHLITALSSACLMTGLGVAGYFYRQRNFLKKPALPKKQMAPKCVQLRATELNIANLKLIEKTAKQIKSVDLKSKAAQPARQQLRDQIKKAKPDSRKEALLAFLYDDNHQETDLYLARAFSLSPEQLEVEFGDANSPTKIAARKFVEVVRTGLAEECAQKEKLIAKQKEGQEAFDHLHEQQVTKHTQTDLPAYNQKQKRYKNFFYAGSIMAGLSAITLIFNLVRSRR